MANDILIVPASAEIQFSGSSANNIKLQVASDGDVSFIGTTGNLVTIEDIDSGSLFTVNSGSNGDPIIEVFSDRNVDVSGSLNVQSYNLNIVALGNTTSTATVNLSNGNYFTATSTGTTTWTFSNATSGRAVGFVLELTNGGAYTQTWPGSVDWPGGSAPSLTSSGVDVLTFITDDGGTTWRGVASMLDSK